MESMQFFHFFVESLPEVIGRKFQAGFNQVGILLDGQAGIFVLVVDDPALALGDHTGRETLPWRRRIPIGGTRLP